MDPLAGLSVEDKKEAMLQKQLEEEAAYTGKSVEEIQAALEVGPKRADGEFTQWLRGCVRRKDRVGALARVMSQDKFWPTEGENLQIFQRYLTEMGARSYVLSTLNQAWAEFGKQKQRQKNRAKTNQGRKAARANRPQKKRRKR